MFRCLVCVCVCVCVCARARASVCVSVVFCFILWEIFCPHDTFFKVFVSSHDLKDQCSQSKKLGQLNNVLVLTCLYLKTVHDLVLCTLVKIIQMADYIIVRPKRNDCSYSDKLQLVCVVIPKLIGLKRRTQTS